MNEKSKESRWRFALRGALLYIAFTAISRITCGIIMLSGANTGEESFYSGIPEAALYAMATVGTLLIFSSFSNLFATFDSVERQRFFEKERKTLEAKAELCDILKSKNFILEGAVCLTLTLLSAILGAYPEIAGIFFSGGKNRSGYFTPLLLIPTLFAIFLLTKYEARRYWLSLYQRHSLDSLSTAKFTLTLFAIVFLYPTVFPLAPILGFMAVTAFNVFLAISKTLTVIGTLIAILLLVFTVVAVLYIAAMLRRRKFLQRLHGICLANGYEISRISRPYKSFFRSECKESFRIKADRKEFECTLISTVDRLVPLVFTSPTDAQFTRRLGTKRRHIDINHPISFYPGGDGEQILIVNPSVKFIFVTDGVEMRELEGPEHLWNFAVYRDFEFLGALERGHIGKV